MRVGLLSSYNHPLLPFFLKAVQERQIPAVLILDEKLVPDAGLVEFARRTDNRLADMNLSIYDFPEIPAYFVRSHNGAETQALAKREGLDVLANCGTPRIIKRDTIECTPIGVLNNHPGRLPDYRGCSAVEWALHNGDPVCITSHLMSEEIDDGPIIAIKEVNIAPTDSYVDIRIKAYMASCDMLGLALSMLKAEGTKILKTVDGGTYYKPIPEDLLQQVIRKRAGMAAAAS